LPVLDPEELIASAARSRGRDEKRTIEQLVRSPQIVQEKDVGRYFHKISDTVGILEKLTADKPGDIRQVFFLSRQAD